MREMDIPATSSFLPSTNNCNARAKQPQEGFPLTHTHAYYWRDNNTVKP